MAKNSSTGSRRSAKSPTDQAPRPVGGPTTCRFCRATIRASDNYCSHCGMPVDPVRDQPLFVVEGLSSLFNTVFFESLLEQELNRATRYGHPLAVLVVEIDSLSELEAAYGYDQTNLLIRAVAEAMVGAVRDPDTIAAANRVTALGTHRFFVLLPETGEEGAFTIADRIRTLVASQVFSIGGTDNRITLSIGVASTVAEQETPNLIGRATQALIEGHALGQNRVEVAASD